MDEESARAAEHAETIQLMRLSEQADAPGTRAAFEFWERDFGAKVRGWRTARSWSQEDLAERMSNLGFEMHQTTVAKIERGVRPLRVSEAVALSTIFGVPPLSVFHGSGPDSELQSLKMMRNQLEQAERGIADSNERIEAAARDVAYWETMRTSVANSINLAALKADNGELTSEE